MVVERIVPGEDRWDVAAHLQRYRFASQFVPGNRVLDAGCGVGYGSRFLAQAGAREVLAVDISEKALATANSKFAHPCIRFLQDDCQVMERVNGHFDVIVALESFEHYHDVRRFLGRVKTFLFPSGVFVCSTPNKVLSAGGNPYHIKEYSYSEFQEILSEYFEDVSVLGQQWTAAFLGLQKVASVLWSSPFLRLGRWVQRLKGREMLFPLGSDLPTEADLAISEANAELAWTFVAVCRNSGNVSSEHRFEQEERR